MTMKSFGENYFRYIPVRQRDVQWGLYVTGAGCTSISPGEDYPPKPHPELYHLRWETRPHAARVPGHLHFAGQGRFRVGPHRQQGNHAGHDHPAVSRRLAPLPAAKATSAGMSGGSVSTAR